MGASLVRRYWKENPQVATMVRAAGARVAMFEPKTRRGSLPGDFFEEMQRALDEAEGALLPGERPLWSAFTSVSEIMQTGAVDWSETPTQGWIRLRSRRGPFVGFLAIGEGGIAFFDAEGRHRGNQPGAAEVAAALRWPWEG